MTDQNDILDLPKIPKTIPRRVIVVLLILGLTLGFLNVFLTAVWIPKGAVMLDPDLGSKEKIMKVTSIPILVFLPIASFVLSILLSLIPYKKIKYSEKFVPFGLATMTLLEFALTILLLNDLRPK